MEETIIKKQASQAISRKLFRKRCFNIQENFFEGTLENHTLRIARHEFRCNGFMKLMGVFIPGAFRNQSKQYMQDFKAFIENNQNV